MEPNASGSKLERFLGSRYFVAVCIVLVALISFGLGRVSGLQAKREPVRVTREGSNNSSPTLPSARMNRSDGLQQGKGVGQAAAVGANSNASANVGQVVASKNGTKYHLPTCSGAKQIAEKNKITFASVEEARKAGYTPASNCPGLK